MFRKVMLGINVLSAFIFFSYMALMAMEKHNIVNYIFGAGASNGSAPLLVFLSFFGLFIVFLIEPWAVNVRIVNDDKTCHCCQCEANHKHGKQ
jgi:hypothetical protein